MLFVCEMYVSYVLLFRNKIIWCWKSLFLYFCRANNFFRIFLRAWLRLMYFCVALYFFVLVYNCEFVRQFFSESHSALSKFYYPIAVLPILLLVFFSKIDLQNCLLLSILNFDFVIARSLVRSCLQVL